MAKFILGTMNFGIQTNLHDSRAIVERYVEKGHFEFDTAFVYNEGQSEELLGKILKDLSIKNPIISSKVNPRVTGKLDKESIRFQVDKSLNRLMVDSLNVLYIHFPDDKTKLEETLQALDELYLLGRFQTLGLSNYSAWQVAEIVNLCQKNSWVTPKIYQGLYNPLSRLIEYELIHALRFYGMKFYAYNPLAGGLLSGKYKSINSDKSDGRFLIRKNYQNRYWHPHLFNLVDLLRLESAKHDCSLIEASLRWLNYHSVLSNQDGILVGVSSEHQIRDNLSMLCSGSLAQSIVAAFDECWSNVKEGCPQYFRRVDNN